MKWTPAEIELLLPVLEQIRNDLEPINGKCIRVLCSAGGEVAFWLAKQMRQGKVPGLELDQVLLASASQLAKEQGLENGVEFRQAEKTYLLLPNVSFDALVSEFIVFPTPLQQRWGNLRWRVYSNRLG
jgi:SAM-dependent methyltransferase